MGEPLLQHNRRTGAYRISDDGGASWAPARVQKNKRNEYRYSIDGGSTWQPYSGAAFGASAPSNDTDIEPGSPEAPTGEPGDDVTLEIGPDGEDGGTSALIARLSDNPHEWNRNDAFDVDKLLKSGYAGVDRDWLQRQVDIWFSRNEDGDDGAAAGEAEDDIDAAPTEAEVEVDYAAGPGQKGYAAPRAGGPERMNGAEAFARRFGQGGSLGFGDELGAMATEGMGALSDFGLYLGEKLGFDKTAEGLDVSDVLEAKEIPHNYKEGSRYKSMRNGLRRDNAQALEDEPGAAIAGDVAGALTLNAVPGMQAKGIPGVMGGGAVAGAGYSDAETLGELGVDAATGAATAGVLAKGGQALGKVAAPALRRVAEAARKKANAARVGATGAYGSDVRAIAESRGAKYADDLGEEIERLGMHEGRGATSDFRRWLGEKIGVKIPGLPQTAETYLANADDVVASAGTKIGQILDDVSAQPGTKIRRTELAARLEQFAEEMNQGMQGDVASLGPLSNKIMEQAALLRSRGAPGSKGAWMTPKELNELKGFFNGEVFKGLRSLDSTAADANRGFGRASRDLLLDKLDDKAPEAAAQLRTANRDYDIGSTVQDAASKRVAQEAGNLTPGLYGMIGGTGGAAAGGPFGAAAGVALGKVAKTRGNAAVAGTQRAIQRGATKLANAAESSTQTAAGRVATQGAAATADDVAAGLMSTAAAEDESNAPRRTIEDIAGEELAPGSSDPLGHYGPMLREAAKRSPQDLAVMQSILQQSDPEFQQLLRQLAGDTEQGQ